MIKKFLRAINAVNTGRPPIWFMRQAGRYHPHYQQVRKQYSFEQICKTPSIALDVARAPFEDFGLDVAILFSDILFLLDVLGQNVSFNDAPKFAWHIESRGDISKYNKGKHASHLDFQYRTLEMMAKSFDGVVNFGFVGGPATLFHFACGRQRRGELAPYFFDAIAETYIENIVLQVKAGAEVIAIFDSSASELGIFDDEYQQFLSHVVKSVKEKTGEIPFLYYIKNADVNIAKSIESAGFSCIGVDEKSDINEILLNTNLAVSGNFENTFLTLDENECDEKLDEYFQSIKLHPRFINSTGHGILPTTKMDNIRKFVAMNSAFDGV